MNFVSPLNWSAALFLSGALLSCADSVTSEQASHSSQRKQVTEAATSPLTQGFSSPTAAYKPLTWYHVMNGNMSKVGLTKDLESMAEVGIGGTILFNVGLNMPKGDVIFNSDTHLDMIGHMAAESKRLGLSFSLHNCDGWSSSGGPWITPELSMKKVTWSETVVAGGNVNIKLREPTSLKNYYRDVAVLAYPSMDTELWDAQQKPTITASDEKFDIKVVSDHDITGYSTINAKSNDPVWLQFAYDKPTTVRFANLKLRFGKKLKYSFHTSDDGVTFTKQFNMPVRRPGKMRWELDEAFEGITAKYFRIVANKSINVHEAHLSATPRMANFLGRSSTARNDYSKLPAIGSVNQQHIIDPKSIRNLTADLAEDGTLHTQLPEGNWTIMRFGYTSTGVNNTPPTLEGRGLEVDKFSRSAFKVHYDAYVTDVVNKVKEVAPNAMQSLQIDSYEVGGQNWTQGYEQQFKEKYGYDLVPFLPLFAGKFVESSTTSEAVLWDTRDLNNHLAVENYYGYFTELAEQDNLTTYIEPYGFGPFNDVDVASKASIPMGEFWLKKNIYMIASSTSAGHIYNKNIISTESFTASPEVNWHFNPASAKFDGDKTWALGVNQFVFHRFVHQANTQVAPGMTMERWGSHFDRIQPWWNTAGKDWFTYISRGQYLLRQGQPVSDVLWYVGDAAPTTCPDKDSLLKQQLPAYINYDCINRDKLQTELSYHNGRLQLDHGVQYKILKLNNHDTLYYESVEKIYQLAKQGAVIVGDPIKKLAGTNITAKQQKSFNEMVSFIWSQDNTYQKAQWHKIYQDQKFNYDLRVVGKDKLFYSHRKTATEDIYFVFNDSNKPALLDAQFNVSGKIPELWDARTGTSQRMAAFSHKDGLTDFAFRLAPNESKFVIFKESSTKVKKVDPQVVREQNVSFVYDDNNNIKLISAENGLVKLKIDGEKRNVPVNNTKSPQTLTGSWQVTFDKFYGLDKTTTFDTLINWKDASDKSIQSYSGIASYKKQFYISTESLTKDASVFLDLGKLSDTAQVFINGQEVGSVWIAPFTLEVSGYLKSGNNELVVNVASSWINRLITDEAYPDNSGIWDNKGNYVKQMPDWYLQNKPLPKGQRSSFTTYKFVNKDDALVESGLLGPVTLQTISPITLSLN
ncbi:MAG: glycosyl hydrolase [Thalassotalea sp.]